jgi:cyclic pyranopterin phosphate synthase
MESMIQAAAFTKDSVSSILVPEAASALVDPFGRHISYIRLSVTDRCAF